MGVCCHPQIAARVHDTLILASALVIGGACSCVTCVAEDTNWGWCCQPVRGVQSPASQPGCDRNAANAITSGLELPVGRCVALRCARR